MSSIQERLARLYPEQAPKDNASWIPKRTRDVSPEGKLRENREKTAEAETQDAEMQVLLNEAIDEIFAAVEDYLFDKFGAGPAFENRLENFTGSFESYYDKLGVILVWALGEMTDEMNFLKQNGHLIHDIVEQKIREIEKREI